MTSSTSISCRPDDGGSLLSITCPPPVGSPNIRPDRGIVAPDSEGKFVSFPIRRLLRYGAAAAAAVTAVVALTGSAHAGTFAGASPNGGDDLGAQVVGGTDATSQYGAVAFHLGDGRYFCTGVQLTRRWVA